MHERQESDFYLAKVQAARQLSPVRIRQVDMPTNAEIRRQIRELDRLDDEEPRAGNLQRMQATVGRANQWDRFQVYEALLLPLENLRQNLKHHPEGDALYHSLQVFDHARDELPYDEDFLLAALLHDVGKAIDRQNHVAAGLEALEATISERTIWLIENHRLAHHIADRTIGSRAHRRLRESQNYADLLLLGECDRAGRQAGVEAPELEEALAYLRDLEQMLG